MDVEIWESEEDCVVPSFLKESYEDEDEDERPWNYVHGNKLFTLDMDGEDPSIFSLRVEILMKDDDGDVGKVEVDLKGVVDSMGLEGRCYINGGWVLPCEEKTSDVFCLMFWLHDLTIGYNEFFYLRKFELADDGSFKILTSVIRVPIPRYRGMLYLGFTPGISKALNDGDYRRKLSSRDRALEKKAEKAFHAREQAERVEAMREEAKREQEEEEEAKRVQEEEEEEAHREYAPYDDAESIDLNFRRRMRHNRRMRRHRR
ncbi:hypothetical protein LINGRAHAP2_LOCUS28971 [Linum grandiflorum]